MLKIGKLQLNSNLILAPMSGITDYPFRMLNRLFGCELAFIEMLNVRSLSHKSRKTKEMLFSTTKDKPLGVQILGKEPQYILKGLEVLNKHKFDILDFNAACPAKKVVRRGEGASLLKEPKKINTLLKLIVENSSLPVTIKIRSGWDNHSINAREVALYAQDAGVKAIFIHGRTKIQEYHGSVDYGVIREVKKAMTIPVIASGDIFSAELAKKMFDQTNCDGLAVARGALGNPWIFKEINTFIKKNKLLKRPGIKEIKQVMIGHLDSYIEFYGERIGVMLFRKFFSWYTLGFRKIRPLREQSSQAKKREEMLGVIEKCGD